MFQCSSLFGHFRIKYYKTKRNSSVSLFFIWSKIDKYFVFIILSKEVCHLRKGENKRIDKFTMNIETDIVFTFLYMWHFHQTQFSLSNFDSFLGEKFWFNILNEGLILMNTSLKCAFYWECYNSVGMSSLGFSNLRNYFLTINNHWSQCLTKKYFLIKKIAYVFSKNLYI
jgi:hypothetical protein